MLGKIRSDLKRVCGQKHKHFADFQRIIKRIHEEYGSLFPKFTENVTGSHYVYDFGLPGIFPITVVKEHGKQEFIPPKFAKRVIQGIEDVLNFIESNEPDDQESKSEGENVDERSVAQEEPGLLPEPKVPDRNSGG